MTKGVLLSPDSFSDSPLIKMSAEYITPSDTEHHSRFSVSGFPTKLLSVIYYTLPHRLEGRWRKSLANVERFLLSVGIPLLDKATSKCSIYSEMMSDAIDKDDDNRLIYLRSLRFLYGIDDMRVTGGREICSGGTKLQCLDRDSQLVKTISIRLANVNQSPLFVLSILWALSTDTDCQVVSPPVQKTCCRVVTQFRERLVKWEEELRCLDY